MKTEQTPVTGKEDKSSLSAQMRAVSDFYTAFNERDIEKMERNWTQEEEAVMDNPVGGVMRGWAEIKRVYEKLFSGAWRIEVEFYDYTLHETDDLFFVIGRERGALKAEDSTLDLQIRTTRVFRLVENEWRQIHHHGSMDDAVMLAEYQKAVKSRK